MQVCACVCVLELVCVHVCVCAVCTCMCVCAVCTCMCVCACVYMCCSVDMGGAPHMSPNRGGEYSLEYYKIHPRKSAHVYGFICASTTLHNSRGSLLRKLKGARVASITQQLHMYFLKILFVEPSAHLVVMKTRVSTALRVTIWSNRSKEIRLCLLQHTPTDTCTGVPCAIDMYNLRKTVGCSLK